MASAQRRRRWSRAAPLSKANPSWVGLTEIVVSTFGFVDPLYRRQIVLDCGLNSGVIADGLAQKVEDPADALVVEVSDGGDRVLEVVAGHESFNDPLAQLALAHELLDGRFFGGPEQRAADHPMSPFDLIRADNPFSCAR